MAQSDPILNVLEKWGEGLVNDAKAAVSSVVKYESGQEADLINKIKFRVVKQNGSYSFQFTMNDFGKVYPYWKDIEFGRKPGKKGVPIDKIGKKWQNSHNINPSKILHEMRLKVFPGSKAKKLSFDRASKSLAFIIQRSIEKKGIKARPFYDKVITDEKINELKEMLKPVLRREYALQLKKELLS